MCVIKYEALYWIHSAFANSIQLSKLQPSLLANRNLCITHTRQKSQLVLGWKTEVPVAFEGLINGTKTNRVMQHSSVLENIAHNFVSVVLSKHVLSLVKKKIINIPVLLDAAS